MSNIHIHIHNRTNLSLKTVVEILDEWYQRAYGETNYVGKEHRLRFENKYECFEMTITIKETCLVVVVTSKKKTTVQDEYKMVQLD